MITKFVKGVDSLKLTSRVVRIVQRVLILGSKVVSHWLIIQNMAFIHIKSLRYRAKSLDHL